MYCRDNCEYHIVGHCLTLRVIAQVGHVVTQDLPFIHFFLIDLTLITIFSF